MVSIRCLLQRCYLHVIKCLVVIQCCSDVSMRPFNRHSCNLCHNVNRCGGGEQTRRRSVLSHVVYSCRRIPNFSCRGPVNQTRSCNEECGHGSALGRGKCQCRAGWNGTCCDQGTRASVCFLIYCNWEKIEKSTPFCIQHFRFHFLEWKLWQFDFKITGICCPVATWQYETLGLDNDLAPNKRQTIAWTNTGLICS